ncbi:unnamed protein product [Caenorhabditis angaria]|uniref:Vacuolar protein sorting-associated protein 18 homolog n=1 Tax=Caenorhabditis angaria TaxID=860376 RepID=A0A9P1IGN7_9PELO|nr:unnamed protein product [Caenorhabditis angaria]
MLKNQQNGIFVRTTLDFKKDLRCQKLTALSHVFVKNGEMLAAISDRLLLRQSVSNSERPQELALPIQAPDAIQHVHLAFSGFHALVSTRQGNNFYIHMKTSTVHHIKKLKTQITAVGWNPEFLKESETGSILLGTSQGGIIELSITSTGIVNVLKELTPQLQAQGSEQKLSAQGSPISEIQLFVADDDPKAKKWLVIITQSSRIVLQSAVLEQIVQRASGFTSSASLQSGFMSLQEMPTTMFHTLFQSKDANCHVINATKLTEKFKNRASLVFYPENAEPKRYAWISPDGVTIGKVDVFAERIQDVLIEEMNLEHRLIEGRWESPLGAVLTDYHVILAFSTRVLAISLLTPNNVVFEDVWGAEFGQALGLSSDPSSEFMWLYTSTGFTMKYRSNDEARYVWRKYLERREYARALQIARTRISIEPEAYELVLRKQADWYIEEKNYTAAAEILAQSSEPFESIVLKFLTNADERKMGLKTLLDKKLEKLTRSEDKMRRDALVLWLFEIQLSELAEMRRSKGKEAEIKDTVDHVQRYFVRKHVFESIQNNTEAVYRICISHVDFDMQLYIANTVKDTRTIVNILMLREQYVEVLDVLRTCPVEDLAYEMAPLLIEHIPKQLIGFFVQNIDRIRPEKLTSTLALCMKNQEMAIAAIKYLEIIMSSSRHRLSKFLHNLFIQLMAKFRAEKLILYLKNYGLHRDNLPYEFDFAMRTCEQYEINDCIIHLFCVAEMYAEAVEKALRVDVELAKRCARMMDAEEGFFGGDEEEEMGAVDLERKKRIWMKIAKHTISTEKDDIPKCINLIKESNDILTIQDILPLFPEFTKVDHFKEALVEYLRKHSKKIEKLQDSMKDATETAAEIREKTEKLKNRVTIIKPGDICAHCARPLVGRPFFVHACRHFFHRDCLELAIVPFLCDEQRNLLKKLSAEETRICAQIEAEIKVGNKNEALVKEKIYEKVAKSISKVIGTDCPLCGNSAILQIDEPFLSDEQFAEEENSWLI